MDGVDIVDSQLAMEYLGRKFGKEVWPKLSSVDKALSRSLRILMEDHLHWVLMIEKCAKRNSSGVLHHLARRKSVQSITEQVLLPFKYHINTNYQNTFSWFWVKNE